MGEAKRGYQTPDLRDAMESAVITVPRPYCLSCDAWSPGGQIFIPGLSTSRLEASFSDSIGDREGDGKI